MVVVAKAGRKGLYPGDSHLKWSEMLVVSLRNVIQGIWPYLGRS